MLPADFSAEAADLDGNVRRTVFPMDGMTTAQLRTALTVRSGKILGWNPSGGYDVSVPRVALAGLMAQGLRVELSPLPVTEALRVALKDKESVVAVIVCEDEAEAVALEQRLGGLRVGSSLQVASSAAQLMDVFVSGAGILAADVAREAVLCNNVVRGERFLGADALQMNVTWMTGVNEVVAVFDTGVSTGLTGLKDGTFHPGLRGRVLQLSPQPWKALKLYETETGECYDANGHGTHVVGSVLGDGSKSTGNRFRGIAPGARLFFQNNAVDGSGPLSLPPTLDPVLLEAYAAGARIHSNSWATSPLNTERFSSEGYGLDAWTLDRFVWEHPDFLPVFGAGNSGTDLDCDGVADYGTLISATALAKNVLAVGAAESFRLPDNADGVPTNTYANNFKIAGDVLRNDSRSSAPGEGDARDIRGLAAFSCRGPLPDGRIKPDVAAPGTRIVSARGPTLDEAHSLTAGTEEERALYAFMDGTSMATPITAGCCAVIRQWCRETLGRTEPSSALVRALLFSGCRSMFPGQFGDGEAREIPSAAPNGAEGFGLISLERALTPENGMPAVETFACPETGTTLEFPVEVKVGGTLRAVLTWVDYPAQVYARSARVNDLNLVLLDAAGQTVAFPNGLQAPDRVNVTERIDATVEPGAYTLRVTASSVPFPGGAAALVMQVPGNAVPYIAHAPIRRLAPLTSAPLEARLLWPATAGDAITLETSSDGKTWTAAVGLTLVAPQNDLLFYRLSAPGAILAGPFTVAVGASVTLTVADDGPFFAASPAVGQTVEYAAGEIVQASAQATGFWVVREGRPITETYTVGGWTLSDVGTGNILALGSGDEAAFVMPSAPATLTWTSAAIRREDWVCVKFVDATLYLPKGARYTLPALNPADQFGKTAVAAWTTPDGRIYAPGSVIGPLTEDVVFSRDYMDWTARWFPAGGYDPEADPDGDGYTNAEEKDDLTNPFDAASLPEPPVLMLTETPPVRSPCHTWAGRIAAFDAHDNANEAAVYVQTRLPGESAWRTASFGFPTNACVVPLGARTEYRLGVADVLGKAFFEGRGGRENHLVWSEVFSLACDTTEPRLRAKLEGARLTLANDALSGGTPLSVTVAPEVFVKNTSYVWPEAAYKERVVTKDSPLTLMLPWNGVAPNNKLEVSLGPGLQGDLSEGTFGLCMGSLLIAGQGFFDEILDPLTFNVSRWKNADRIVCSAESEGSYTIDSLRLTSDIWTAEGAPAPFSVTLAPGEERSFTLDFTAAFSPSCRRAVLTSNDPQNPSKTLQWWPGYRLRLN